MSWGLIWNLSFDLVFGRVRLTTCMVNAAHSVPSVNWRDPRSPKTPHGPLTSGRLARKVSCDFTGGWVMKLSTNQQKSTYIKRSVSAQPELCISASHFCNLVLETHCTCVRTHMSHLYWIKNTKWKLMKSRGKSWVGLVRPSTYRWWWYLCKTCTLQVKQSYFIEVLILEKRNSVWALCTLFSIFPLHLFTERRSF